MQRGIKWREERRGERGGKRGRRKRGREETGREGREGTRVEGREEEREGAREIDPQLRALATLAEHPGSVCSAEAHNHL